MQVAFTVNGHKHEVAVRSAEAADVRGAVEQFCREQAGEDEDEDEDEDEERASEGVARCVEALEPTFLQVLQRQLQEASHSLTRSPGQEGGAAETITVSMSALHHTKTSPAEGCT